MKTIILCSILIATSMVRTPIAQASVDVPVPKHLIVAVPTRTTSARDQATITTARLFYAGWNTGRRKYFKESLAPNFIDRTLPAGRPQGPDGPPTASDAFRKLVPNLRCVIEEMVVAGDTVTVRQRYTGTSTTGRHIDFPAIDVLRIRGGRIIMDWHLEDYRTFDRELGSR